MAEKNPWDLTSKPQTKTKLKILKDYLSAWAKIFAKQKWCNTICYIDCFAGRGKYHNDGQKDVINGSPLIALNIAKEIKQRYQKEMVCFFAENNSRVFHELENITVPFKSQGLTFECINKDINNAIDQVLTLIPSRAPIFFFIDPSGINIKREMIEKMLALPNIKEFLINYIQKGVERCYAFGKKSEEDLPIDIHKRAVGNLKRIQDFFGKDWQCLSNNDKDNLKLFLSPFGRYNEKAILKNRFSAKVIDIWYNRNRNKYYLLFLSRHPAANKIIESIYTTVKLDGTLFQNLPAQEKKKMYQGKFDI